MLSPSPSRRGKRALAQVSTAEDAPRPRKRDRYTRIACEYCKSRKVKCSGNLPCSRCSELNADCTYSDFVPQSHIDKAASRKEEKSSSQSAAIPPDLSQLLSILKKTCDQIQTSANYSSIAAPVNSSLTRRVRLNSDVGFKDTASPANFVHSLNLARSVLEERGVIATPSQSRKIPAGSKTTGQSPDTKTELLRAARPLLDIGYEGVMQYLAIFNIEIYPSYPCIKLDMANRKIKTLFDTPQQDSKDEGSEETDENSEVDLIDVEITKTVIAVAMLAIGEETALATDLACHLIWNTDQNIKQENAQTEDIIMASLLAIYFILKGEAVKAWRMASLASRTCIEMGINRRRFFFNATIPLDEAIFLKTLFSCVYDLDKRCSFYVNLPWTLYDKIIDEKAFDLDSRHTFLSAMTALSRLCAEIIELVNTSTLETKETDDRAEYFDFRVQKLVERITQTSFFPPESDVVPNYSKQIVLNALFQLRTNQIRMLTHIRCLSSSKALACRPRSARTMMSLAKSTVRLHAQTVASGEVGRFLRPLFDKLLIGAISYMFLAASYDPNEYGPMCGKDFHLALNSLSESEFRLSGPNSNIWCTLDDMRTIAQSIRMPTPETSPSMVTGSDEPSALLEDIQRHFVGGEIFGTFESTDRDLLGLFGDCDSRGSDLSDVNSYSGSVNYDSAMPPPTWFFFVTNETSL